MRIDTDKQMNLLSDKVFVRASERDVFQLMQRFPVLSFLPRVRERKREYFPYLSDAAMENLQSLGIKCVPEGTAPLQDVSGLVARAVQYN